MSRYSTYVPFKNSSPHTDNYSTMSSEEAIFKELEESTRNYNDMKETISSLNSVLQNLNIENLSDILKSISSQPPVNCISMPYKEHDNFKNSIKQLCSVRPVLLSYKATIDSMASLDFDALQKRIEKQVEEVEKQVEEVSNIISQTEKNVTDLIAASVTSSNTSYDSTL